MSPDRPPVPPCVGWLAHNTRNCDCYADQVAAPIAPPTCSTCNHSWKQHSGGGWMCQRGLTSFSVISGERSVSNTCDYERSRFWRWLGADTCGREGRYWTPSIAPTPPTGGSCVSNPARPSR